MVPEEWPISVPAGGPGEPLRKADGGRLSVVMADFFLDPAKRLSEQERALIGALLDGLIGWVADQVRSVLPLEAVSANDADGHALRERLCSAGLLQRRDLMSLLLRSADGERIASALRSRFPGAPSLLQRLISSPSPDVASAAMELILARGRRRDRFGQPRLDFDDLPDRIAAGLAHGVAAALRATTIAIAGEEGTDAELAAAADALVRGREPDKAIAHLGRALVEALAAEGLLDEALLAAALREGDVALVAEALAFRAGIDGAAAWDLMLAEPGGTVRLLRMAGVSRQFAAELIAAIGDQLGIADAQKGIESFQSLDETEVRDARAWMQLDPAYRAAIEGLGGRG